MQSTQTLPTDFSRPAGADLRTNEYQFVKLNATGKVILCSAAGELSVGVLQNKPNIGEAASVRPLGRTPVVVAVALNPMDLVATDAAGKARVANRLVQASGAGSHTLGFVVSPPTTAANQIAEIVLTGPVLRPTSDT
jgi:hypothetical protein